MRIPLLLSSLLLGSTVAQLSVSSTARQGDVKQPVQLRENERIAEYHKRNYTWPIQNYSPNTPGWKNLMDTRFRQVEEVERADERYQGYIQTIHSAFLVPNFTEHGFGLARCPEGLLRDLREGVREGAKNPRFESNKPVIDGPMPWFVDRPDLTNRVLHDLRNYAETWSGLELTPHQAYGFRLYRNESRLWMHVDRMQTHIISFILHIDSSEDAEPWPIFIEDFHGRTHEVLLTPGDILFYESSKCFHGRPRVFNGSWYSSLFVHYYPSNGWYDLNHELEAHYAVPPRWSQNPTQQTVETLEIVGTSIMEPNCPDNWCGAQNSVKWSGPGEEGFWIDPQFQKHEFNPVFGDHEEL